MRLTALTKAMLLAAIGDVLSNGTIVTYAGEPPAEPGDTPQSSFALAELRFTSFGGVTSDGDIEAASLRSGVGKATGTPRWFQARDAQGRVVMDGLVGSAPGQLQIDPPQIIQGGRVDGVRFVLGW